VDLVVGELIVFAADAVTIDRVNVAGDAPWRRVVSLVLRQR
jgi:hypothetical protein